MSGRTMIVRETWPHALHTRMNYYAVGKLFMRAQIGSLFYNMSLRHVHVFGLPF